MTVTQPQSPVDPRIAAALEARHVAVFGASSTPGKWGYNAADRIVNGGFAGKVTLVNPRGGTVLGRPLEDYRASEGADLAVVATPAASVASVIEQCGEVGIGMAVVYAGGFRETGVESNVDREAALLDKARRSDVRIVGPNSLGLFSNTVNLNVTMVPNLPGGAVSMISQSGGVAQQAAHRLSALGSGYDVMLSLGNKLDLTLDEAIGAVSGRPSTESIFLYLERLDEGDRFLDSLALLTQEVPVVALLAGRTVAGRRATVSHTGSLMGNWERVAGLLRDSGALVVERLEDAVAAAAGARRVRARAGRRVFVLSDGGGHSVLFSDALDLAGYELHPPDAELKAELEPLVGPVISALNPMDLQGAADSDPTLYYPLVDAVLRSGDYDSLVVGGIFGGYEPFFDVSFGPAEQETARRIGRRAAEFETPVVFQSVYATDSSLALRILREEGVPCLEWPHEIVKALDSMSTASTSSSLAPAAVATAYAAELVGLTARVAAALEKHGVPHELGDVMDQQGCTTLPDGRYVLRLDGFPHKTAAGAIEVGIEARDCPAAHARLADTACEYGVPAVVRVGRFVPHTDEVLVTLFRDDREGSGMLVGAGGVDTESVRDYAIARLPKNEGDVVRALSRTRVGRRIRDAGGGALDRLAGAVVQLVHVFVEELPDLYELEINPIGVTTDTVMVLDALPSSDGSLPPGDRSDNGCMDERSGNV